MGVVAAMDYYNRAVTHHTAVLDVHDDRFPDGEIVNCEMQGTSAMVYGLLGYVFGNEFLDDLAEFLTLFKDMVDDFRERHDEVQRIFHDHRTTFITVCAPTEPSVEVAGFFAEELGRRGYPRGGTVVNQVHRCNDEPLEAGVLLHAFVAQSCGA